MSNRRASLSLFPDVTPSTHIRKDGSKGDKCEKVGWTLQMYRAFLRKLTGLNCRRSNFIHLQTVPLAKLHTNTLSGSLLSTNMQTTCKIQKSPPSNYITPIHTYQKFTAEMKICCRTRTKICYRLHPPTHSHPQTFPHPSSRTSL